MGAGTKASGPDFTAGIDAASIAEGVVVSGQAYGEPLILVRRGAQVHALHAHCNHYSGPLAEGLVVGDQIRCPLHHARFRLSDGQALAAPALGPVACYRVEQIGDRIFVRERLAAPAASAPPLQPASVLIIGGGAAGDAAAVELRRRGYSGPLTVLEAGALPPVDRTNLSKDYLGGAAPEDWLWIRPRQDYDSMKIELLTGRRVGRIDTAAKKAFLEDGSSLSFDRLILATGASALRPPIVGANHPRVCTLRTLSDAKAILAQLKPEQQVVLLGASFIALEAAASLRAHGISATVVAPDETPLQRVLGKDIGRLVQGLHEAKGVQFRLGRSAREISEQSVILDDGSELPASLVVLGVGVRPNLALAEESGLKVERGVVVDASMRSSAPGIYAVGDIARYPDAWSGEHIRVEHWVAAQRQAQIAVHDMLGIEQPTRFAPFFWSHHYDLSILYTGHAESWDAIEYYGDLQKQNALAAYRLNGRVMAVASLNRDRENLQIEAAMEANDDAALEQVLASAR
ncbi:MAG: FAD-dependent oxidoreductase [Leptospirales bacterium]|nr:FAD-dependent oxidoreductase [Leptospirales bacterium]